MRRAPHDAPRLAAALALGIGLTACDPPEPKTQPEPAARPAEADRPTQNPLKDAVDDQRAEAERAEAELKAAMEEQARAKAALEAELARAEAEPEAKPPATPARYRPRLLDDAPAKASIDPGEYLCKISREYKLRPCSVRVDERGHTILAMPEALLAIEGVLYDEGDVVHFDGWTTEERPFGCFICAERCATDPKSCACTEIQPAASAHCLAQPVIFDLKRSGKGWKGTLRYALYSNRYEGAPPSRRPTGYEFEVESFVVELRPSAGG